VTETLVCMLEALKRAYWNVLICTCFFFKVISQMYQVVYVIDM